ncbi:hypothetical protein [Endozoicomonas arenosclerae]|uniref:hypothetical protein n=1 Tax=Endozoicomonas arenosclerae TaxID=1633495 RepID=UPI000B0099A7|nr:hypothetical protein [Endozoicomonas arenosclerae]
MKQLKVAVKKRHQEETSNDPHDIELKQTLERLKKKGFNPMQMCNKLIEHEEPAPEDQIWNYDLVVAECKRLKVSL